MTVWDNEIQVEIFLDSHGGIHYNVGVDLCGQAAGERNGLSKSFGRKWHFLIGIIRKRWSSP